MNYDTRSVRDLKTAVINTRLNATVSDAGNDVSSAWQWREGRLLAYELILQFLVKNHLLYTFGTAQPSTSADDHQTRLPRTW